MDLQPGQVMAVRVGSGWTSRLIRFGACCRDKPNIDNHCAVVHHQDSKGVWWGLEGRPGGVGWIDLRRYLKDPYTVINTEQPLNGKGGDIAKAAEQMIGTEYDWAGIGADAFRDLGLPGLFEQNWHGTGAPGHVVCSSYVAWLYAAWGLAHPSLGEERRCQPYDWTVFIMEQGWRK